MCNYVKTRREQIHTDDRPEERFQWRQSHGGAFHIVSIGYLGHIAWIAARNKCILNALCNIWREMHQWDVMHFTHRSALAARNRSESARKSFTQQIILSLSVFSVRSIVKCLIIKLHNVRRLRMNRREPVWLGASTKSCTDANPLIWNINNQPIIASTLSDGKCYFVVARWGNLSERSFRMFAGKWRTHHANCFESVYFCSQLIRLFRSIMCV